MIQDEYFSVHAGLTINVEPLDENTACPDEEAFRLEIPPLFRVASECSELEESTERLLSNFGSDDSKALIGYLGAQNTKINLLLSYVLSQQDDPAIRFTTRTFGASRLSFLSPTPLATGCTVRMKLFLTDPPAAIYCYADVIDCQPYSNQTGDAKGNSGDKNNYEVHLCYSQLLENDRDLLIRAALHVQQKLLRERAQQRSNS
ncbi:PilZ domain-containing protein [Photobacterium sanguinicancri]|uniref:PilZ domain-containing protein n=1 Tax=Photobacterium sanguinicancri TaxID=875932 RepID=A0ABX4G0Q9_9GAMM|nr:PilZ domain-containing protein [Photobacterium sanguinicancri]OZS44631.1 PilZ domain-containing protein [Photobacterium sanguinicancri]